MNLSGLNLAALVIDVDTYGGLGWLVSAAGGMGDCDWGMGTSCGSISTLEELPTL